MLTENEKREKADSALGRMMWLVILWGLVGLPLRLVSAIVSRVFVVMYPWDVDYWFWKNVVSPYAENHYPAKHPVRENAKLQYPGRVVLAHELYYQPTEQEGKYTHPELVAEDLRKRLNAGIIDLQAATETMRKNDTDLRSAADCMHSLQRRVSELMAILRANNCPFPEDAVVDSFIKSWLAAGQTEATPMGHVGSNASGCVT